MPAEYEAKKGDKYVVTKSIHKENTGKRFKKKSKMLPRVKR